MRCPQVRDINDVPNLPSTKGACNGTRRQFDANLVLTDSGSLGLGTSLRPRVMRRRRGSRLGRARRLGGAERWRSYETELNGFRT